MPAKNMSSVTFWSVVIGGGFLVLLLVSFNLFSGSGRMMRGNLLATRSSVGNMMGVSTGSVGQGSFGLGVMPIRTSYDEAAVDAYSMPYPSPVPPMMYGGDTAATATPRIIRTGSMTLEVASSRDSAQKITDLAKAQNGFVESSNVLENADGTVTGYVTIRVPEDKFEATLAQLRDLALRVSSESVNGQDVTEQYTDLEARLKAKQAEEAQYLVLLNKATSVQDMLQVTQYLSQVRSEIESIQGQMKYLGNQTSYSTISVSLTEQANLNLPAGKFDLLRDMKQAGQAVILLVQALLTFAVWFIVIGGAILIPTAVVVFVVYKLIKRLVRS